MPLVAVPYEQLTGFGPGADGRIGRVGEGRYRVIPAPTCTPQVMRCGCGPTVGIAPPWMPIRGEQAIPAYCPPPPKAPPQLAAIGPVIKQAMIDAMRDAPSLTVQRVPIETPGFRGKRQKITTPLVICAAGASAGQVAAAAYLRAALAGPNVNQLAATPTVIDADSTAVAGLTYQAPDSMQGVMEKLSVGLSSIDAANGGLKIAILKSGQEIQPEVSVIDDEPIPLLIPFGPGDQIVITFRSLDPSIDVWVVWIQLDLWLTPVKVRDDSLYSRILRRDPSWPQANCP